MSLSVARLLAKLASYGPHYERLREPEEAARLALDDGVDLGAGADWLNRLAHVEGDRPRGHLQTRTRPGS
jgi:hypothetical protein